jgi:hypothetical protein
MDAAEILQIYYSNLYKYDIDKWMLYVNESNLTAGNYTYYSYAKDSSSNENRTETRLLTILGDITSPTITNQLNYTSDNINYIFSAIIWQLERILEQK